MTNDFRPLGKRALEFSKNKGKKGHKNGKIFHYTKGEAKR
jgi:hypothetical protein